MNYFITAIGTDSGKSLFSAIICEALEADYWKPIQAGYPRDTDYVGGLLSNLKSELIPEKYVLNTPASPHYAAEIDNIKLEVVDFDIPKTENDLIIEGAGGVLVPINNKEFVIDFPKHWNIPVILVANLYLGSINHTLLTINELKRRGVEVKGIVFNGPSNPSSEDIILKHSGYNCLLRIKEEKEINHAVVRKYAAELKKNL
ncbi:dethiobiotin synthase [Marivirga salinae]|uniref:ATP-dependent dethiobiotin synthetase BioD n=1 Tax=Marivirga salinarum TaxID=3059078 RepID=A0AA49GDH5_9BACT|nr:dethiobiotin synthase [Marivirga sp. BDSF4-3]WKK78295.2 dethiobiotin synthase [Marivirga sp. BDSF4-3]